MKKLIAIFVAMILLLSTTIAFAQTRVYYNKEMEKYLGVWSCTDKDTWIDSPHITLLSIGAETINDEDVYTVNYIQCIDYSNDMLLSKLIKAHDFFKYHITYDVKEGTCYLYSTNGEVEFKMYLDGDNLFLDSIPTGRNTLKFERVF